MEITWRISQPIFEMLFSKEHGRYTKSSQVTATSSKKKRRWTEWNTCKRKGTSPRFCG
jgi:hypothetical protein